MKNRFQTKLLTWSCLIGTLLALTTILFVWADRVDKQHGYWINHTHRVIEQTNQLLLHLLDSETGQRGYLLTKDGKYLDPHQSGMHQARLNLSRLKQLTRDSATQQALLTEVSMLMDQKFSELEKTIYLIDLRGLDEALAVVNTHQGIMTMDQIRVLLKAHIDQQRELLNQHKQESLQLQSISRFVYTAIIVSIALLCCIAAWVINSSIIRPFIELEAAVRMLANTNELPESSREKLASGWEPLVKIQNKLEPSQ